jgi:PAS domain-containing protein
MKILYVSPEQRDASLSQALRTAGSDVVLSGATHLGDAARWIFGNLDVAALILDGEFGQPQCASFLRNLRSRGLSVPLILMAPERDGWMEGLGLSTDDCIVQKELLLSDFEGAVRRAVYRARPSAAFEVLARHVVDIHRHLERTDREHDLRIEVGDLRAAHTASQEQLTRAEAALDQSTAHLASAEVERRELEKRHACATAAERAKFAEREARLIGELANAITIKDALDRQVAEHHTACETLRQELESKNATLERLGQRERELEMLLADATNSCDALVNQLATTQASLRAAEERAREQRVEALNEQTQLARERSDYHASLNTLQERVRQLEIEREALQRAFASTQSGLDRTIAELEGALDTAARELVSTRTERDGLRANVEQARQLHGQLEEVVQRVGHEFDNFPLPLCRATRAGVITHANRAFGALLGCPSAGAKRRLTLASELFESSKELAWLVERSASSEDGASVECTRRKVDESRLMLRLRAMPAPDGIHIVVEDLTPNWILQERLIRAQQMEAVGRMTAEVALTCVNFLRDVTDHGRRFIAMLESGSEARRSGEHMIGGVDRVEASLLQLARYADEQAMSLEPVDLHQVLRDLEPILQELAGDDVQVVLPELPAPEETPFTVDVTAQRVERMLINLARYSRGRIPSGGRIVFDIASTTVDGQFVAKYPNVRQGPHVLLTVTQDGAQASTAGGNGSEPSVSGTAGGDLSALHGLVRHCGGHLWMDTDTTGEMQIKIHLPLRAA